MEIKKKQAKLSCVCHTGRVIYNVIFISASVTNNQENTPNKLSSFPPFNSSQGILMHPYVYSAYVHIYSLRVQAAVYAALNATRITAL